MDCNKRVWICIDDWLAFGGIDRYCGGGLWILQMIGLDWLAAIVASMEEWTEDIDSQTGEVYYYNSNMGYFLDRACFRGVATPRLSGQRNC